MMEQDGNMMETRRQIQSWYHNPSARLLKFARLTEKRLGGKHGDETIIRVCGAMSVAQQLALFYKNGKRTHN